MSDGMKITGRLSGTGDVGKGQQGVPSSGLTVSCKVHFRRAGRGRVELHAGPEAVTAPPSAAGRVPRIARLMALALRFDDLLQRREVRDFADLARLGHVTRARVTQVMNLLMLAPDLQEQILFLPAVERGHDPVKEWQVRPIAAEPLWARQRLAWRRLMVAGAGRARP